MDVSLYVLTIISIFTNQMSKSSGMSCSTFQFIESEQASYEVHTQKSTWYDARKMCASQGAVLLYPGTAAEVALMLNLLEDAGLKNSRVWIGAHDILSEGLFVQLDGKKICNAPWASGEPNVAGDDKDCVMAVNGKMAVTTCKDLHPFICKKFIVAPVCQTFDQAYVPDSDNSSCYKLHQNPKTWPQAYATCVEEGSYLAVINSRSEADFLVKLTKNIQDEKIKVDYHKHYIGIGFHDLFEEGEYLTVQGEPLEQVDYKEWLQNMPDNWKGDEDCGSINKSGKLNDIGCGVRMVFICERTINHVVDVFSRMQAISPKNTNF